MVRQIIIILLAAFTLMVFAGNPPDQGKSTISGTQAPADGLTSSTVTVVLRDSGGNTLPGNDSVTVTSSDSTTSFNPSSVTLDGSGTFYTQVKSQYVGSVPVTVTDITASNTKITGYVAFYQPGTAAPTAGACTDPAPGGGIKLTSAQSSGPNSITLTWTDATNPVTYYLVSYGLSSGNYKYGSPNVGGQGTTSYTVGALTTGTTYYFAVRAGNGCTPGNFSNELAATVGGNITPTPAPVVKQATVAPTPTPQNSYAPVPTDIPILPANPAPTPPDMQGSNDTGKIVFTGTVIGVLLGAGAILWYLKIR